jgi:hypothetical protein
LEAAVPVALEIGWTMAILFGDLPQGETSQNQLPTEHELPEGQRIQVELVRLSCLLAKLTSQFPPDSHSITADTTSLQDAWHGDDASPSTDADRALLPETPKAALRDKLLAFNLALLKELACVGRELELAYQVGRSLRDTVSPPKGVASADRVAGKPPPPNVQAANQPADAGRIADLLRQLARRRVAVIQEWCKELGPYLPTDSGTVVSRSLGRWSDLASTALDQKTPGRLKQTAEREKFAGEMTEALLPQGDVWLSVLTGDKSTAGLLSPEGYVAAGEAALSRSLKIAGKVVRHYWVALVLLAIALAAVLALASASLGGAGMVWTQIAAIASSLGVTAKGIGSAMARLTREGERPIYALEKQEAIAWAITNLPTAELNTRGVLRLRQSGVSRSAPLGKA